ncbi:MAG TPA: hypothetical protein VKT77_20780 [Chthonomonadaceae bacterium]|nr:hypothetical protein [Chthonomonadaceae bacterium]
MRPTPPHDPFTSQPLHYRRDGQGFVLYSVGQDLKDDGGNDTPPPSGA